LGLYDTAPRPPPYPLSILQGVSLSQSSCVSPVSKLTDERGGKGGGRKTKLYDRTKAWPSTNHSVVSGLNLPRCRGSIPSSLGRSTLQPNAQRVCARPSRPSRAQMWIGASPSLSCKHANVYRDSVTRT
jgi:hypothetical protein